MNSVEISCFLFLKSKPDEVQGTIWDWGETSLLIFPLEAMGNLVGESQHQE